MPRLGPAPLRRYFEDLPITFILVGIIGLCFVAQNLLPGWVGAPAVRRFGRLGVDTLWASGSIGPHALFGSGEWWRLASATFLHGHLIHFLMNAIALAQLGPIAEALLGRGRTLLTWLVTGITASLVSATYRWFREGAAVGVGASGAVFGLIGVLLIQFRRSPGLLARHHYRRLLELAVINGVLGFVIPQIDNAAHLGGLAAGALLGVVFPVRAPGRRTGLRRIATIVLVLATAAAVGIAAGGAPRRLALLHGTQALGNEVLGAIQELETGGERPEVLAGRIETLSLPQELQALQASAVDSLRRGDGAPALLPIWKRIQDRLLSLAPDFFAR